MISESIPLKIAEQCYVFLLIKNKHIIQLTFVMTYCTVLVNGWTVGNVLKGVQVMRTCTFELDGSGISVNNNRFSKQNKPRYSISVNINS